jgi:hypothetical protein
MAEKIRTKPSSLHRLVATIAQRVLDSFAEKVRASGRNLEKLELVLFLRGLKHYDRNAETSFAEEKVGKEKASDYLKRTKFQTMKFLISELALISPYPHQDLHLLIGEIRVMMHHAVFPDVLQVIDEAITIAKERELFFEWRQLLQFQLVAVQRCLFGKELLGRVTETHEEIKMVSRQIEANEEWEDLKSKTIVPLKAYHDENREWYQELADLFQLRESAIIPPNGTRQLIDFHDVWILILARSANTEILWGHLQELLLIFKHDKKIREEFIGEYARVLTRMIVYSHLFLKKDEAHKSLVLPLAALVDSDELSRALCIDKVIIGFFVFSRRFSDIRKANQAAKLFEENKSRFKDDLRGEVYLQISYLYLYHKFELGDFLTCTEIIEQIFALGVEARIDLQCHYRTILIIANYLSGVDRGNFGVTCSHAVSFLTSKDTPTEVQEVIVNALNKCANKSSNLLLRESVWRETIESLKKVVPGSGELDTFDYISFWTKSRTKIIQRQ